jgi:hypothetical protein
MANQVQAIDRRMVSTPPDLSELDKPHRIAALEYGFCLVRTVHRSPTRDFGEDRAEFEEVPASRNSAALGAIAGVILGAGFYGAVLFLFGVIKL